MQLSPTDSVSLLAVALLDARRRNAEEKQSADLARARTGADQLMAVGVLVTEDTAMENAFRQESRKAEADKRGVPVSVVVAEREFAQAKEEVLSYLRETVRCGETSEEWNERITTALAQVVGVKDNGKPCQHKDTQRERAWYNRVGGYTMQATDSNGFHPFRCARCDAQVDVPSRPEAPTEQARIAQIILDNEGTVQGPSQEPV